MEAKDILAFVAIAISLVSLGVSVWSFLIARGKTAFDRRAKNAELRASLLAKVADLSTRSARVLRFAARVQAFAKETDDEELYQLGAAEIVTTSHTRVADLHDEFFSVPAEQGLSAYEAFYHKLQEADAALLRIEELTQELDIVMERKRAKVNN